MTTGTVLTGRNNIFTVLVSGEQYLCRIKGKVLELDEPAYNPLAPGDIVGVDSLDIGNRSGVIEERRPRKNSFARFNLKRGAVQTLGANIDAVVCLMSIHHPPWRQRFVDRVLVLAEHYQVEPVVVITKADLDSPLANEISVRLGETGYEAVVTSVVGDGTEQSVEAMIKRIKGKRSVVVGQSGVGKSTLINQLIGDDVQAVGAINRRFNRGRHTTTAGVLIQRSGLELIDTPGIRELDCRHVGLGRLASCYRDFGLGGDEGFQCAHGDCSHRVEPGCEVRAAVRDGIITEDRYESYLRLYHEIEAALGEDS